MFIVSFKNHCSQRNKYNIACVFRDVGHNADKNYHGRYKLSRGNLHHLSDQAIQITGVFRHADSQHDHDSKAQGGVAGKIGHRGGQHVLKSGNAEKAVDRHRGFFYNTLTGIVHFSGSTPPQSGPDSGDHYNDH